MPSSALDRRTSGHASKTHTGGLWDEDWHLPLHQRAHESAVHRAHNRCSVSADTSRFLSSLSAGFCLYPCHGSDTHRPPTVRFHAQAPGRPMGSTVSTRSEKTGLREGPQPEAPQQCPSSNLGHLTREPTFSWPARPPPLGSRPAPRPSLLPFGEAGASVLEALSQQEGARLRPRDWARVTGAMGVPWWGGV